MSKIFFTFIVMTRLLIDQLLSYRSGSVPTKNEIAAEFMSHATVALDALLRRRDFPYVFVPQQEQRMANDEEEEFPQSYRPLFLRPTVTPFAAAYMKPLLEVPNTYEEIISQGYFMKNMESLIFACGGTTIMIQFSIEGITAVPLRVPASTIVHVLVECLSSSGKLREESDMMFERLTGEDKSNGQHNVRQELLAIVKTIIHNYVATEDGGLGTSNFPPKKNFRE